jgi:aspartyl/glutamyl-tRNA(Asn/Gln) amidotransferase C subunit
MKKPEIDIAGLAKLARLDVPAEELSRLEKEIPAILAFVETIQEAGGETKIPSPGVRNVMRPDENPHEPGLHTKTLLASAPAREGDRIAVKQVISRKAV